MRGDGCIGLTLALLEDAFPCHHRVVTLYTPHMSFDFDSDEKCRNIEVDEFMTFGAVIKSRVVKSNKLLGNLVDVCHRWTMRVVEQAKG